MDDREVVDSILSAMKDVKSYIAFDSTVRLGLTMDANTLPFERIMVFGWIKDLINERKT